jgi:pyruvate dehydrogenase E2 component (dihydrolipoamide acetyltransferase)
MKREFKLPDLGENIEGGDVIGVLVAIGDRLEEDQPVIELETDKAVIEVPSSVAGTIVGIHVNQGERAAVGASILTVEVDGVEGETSAAEAPVAEAAEPAVDTPPPLATPAPESPSPIEAGPVALRLPDLGENIDAGEVVNLLVKEGDSVSDDQPLLELETDKAVIEVPSSVSGQITKIHVAVGDRVQIGELVATVEATGVAAAAGAAAPAPTARPARPEPPEPAAPVVKAGAGPPGAAAPATAGPPAPPATGAAAAKPVPAAPSVRRLAREIGVNIAAVTGTGPGGRISSNDVKNHARELNTGRTSAPLPGLGSGELQLPDFSQWGEIEREPMSNVRRTTAVRLSQAWATIPHVTQFDKADVTELEKARKGFAKRVEAAGGKLTPAVIVLKVVASALKVFPRFNASIDMANQEIIYKRYCHIGVAVDTDRGLLVPVVRDVDQKNLIELTVELGEIAAKARGKKLRPDGLQGGCFTVSNLGSIGGTGFSPIVNPPEVAILGVARSAQEPVFVDGEFKPRLLMPLSLSYDHRIIDGADGARFLRWIAQALENPLLILLEG